MNALSEAAAVVFGLFAALSRSANADVQLVGLAEPNVLLRFASERPSEVSRVDVTGVGGTLLGIDVRTADGLLYGVSAANDLYTIDAATGAARLVSTLTVPFEGSPQSGFDFNPQADRLRLIAASGQNLRVNVDLGAVATDGGLVYPSGDRYAGARPRITAIAYTNNRPSATETRLFDIDCELDVLAVQDPPNDGTLRTIGPLGVDFGPRGGFDILSGPDGLESAFAASGAELFAIDLATGAAAPIGKIGNGRLPLIGLAVDAAASPGSRVGSHPIRSDARISTMDDSERIRRPGREPRESPERSPYGLLHARDVSAGR